MYLLCMHVCSPLVQFLYILLHMPNRSLLLLTLGAHAQRGLQYLVCVSVTQHLTFHVIIRTTIDNTYRRWM